MRKLIVLSSLGLALLALQAPVVSAAAVYRPGEGFHSEDKDSGPMEPSAGEQLKKARALEEEGDSKRALGAYQALLNGFSGSGASPLAQFKIAEMNEKIGEPERAFKAYGKYIADYPRGKEFDLVVERQFGIAKAFLNGERRKLFGVKTFSSMEQAQKMFEEIVKNAPYSKFAALAQFNIGMALEKQDKYPEAVAAYQLTVDKYPNDDVAGDAQYQIGYVQMHLLDQGSNDHAARVKAKDAFEDFLVRYPQSEKIQQAQANVTKLSGNNLKKTLEIAKFYDRTRNYKAAAIYYNDILQAGKDTPEGQEAAKNLERLHKSIDPEVLRAGPENAETGGKAREHRKLQAQVDTASRPDYAGPPAPAAPEAALETMPAAPQLRSPNLPLPPEAPLPSAE